MTKLRPRARLGRLSSGSNQVHQWKLNTCLIVGCILLLGLVAYLQLRIGKIGAISEWSDEDVEQWHKNQTQNEEFIWQVLQEIGEESGALAEVEGAVLKESEKFRKQGYKYERGEDGDLDNENPFLDALERSEEEERKIFANIGTHMDMEDDEMDEFESFGGDVGAWLNEVDKSANKERSRSDGFPQVADKRSSVTDVPVLSDLELDEKLMSKSTTGSEGGKEGMHSPVKDTFGGLVTKKIDDEADVGDRLGKYDISQKVTSEVNAGEDASIMDDSSTGPELDARGFTSDALVGAKSKDVQVLGNTQRAVNHSTSRHVVSISTSSESKGSEMFSQSSLSTYHLRGLPVEKDPTAIIKSKSGIRHPAVGYFQPEARDRSRSVFSTDDEIIDEAVSNRLEQVVDIEDALLIKRGRPIVDRRLVKPFQLETYKREISGKVLRDPLNPVDNPLLQDPDTIGPSGVLTKSDLSLTAFKWIGLESESVFRGNVNHNTSEDFLDGDVGKRTSFRRSQESASSNSGSSFKNSSAGQEIKNTSAGYVKSLKSESEINKEQSPGNTDSGSRLAPKEAYKGDEKLREKTFKGSSVKPKQRSNGDTRQWGSFPGLDSMLSFSEFMGEFLFGSCSVRVFMAWTTPPWSFTVRHQRVVESLLNFNPQACVVVFSESLELDFFKSFVQDGYRIAVVMPQLQELLEDTPTDVFAKIWLQWRKVDLFYLHYPELLRLAALYKYGGIYLDMDVLVLKPLEGFHNTLGSETVANGEPVLNGALMIFNKSSPFLWSCLVEFAASYDETLEQWNGGALLNRMVHSESLENWWLGNDEELHVEPPQRFYPLSSSVISKYFTSPEDEDNKKEQENVLQNILQNSYTVHLWNAMTSRLVPDAESLVAKLFDRICLRCTDII